MKRAVLLLACCLAFGGAWGRDAFVAKRFMVAAAHPLAAEAFAGLGVTRYQQGRRDEARRAIERALALDARVQNADALRRLLEGP